MESYQYSTTKCTNCLHNNLYPVASPASHFTCLMLYRRPGTVTLMVILLASLIAASVTLVYYRSSLHSSLNSHGSTYLSRDSALISYAYAFCDKLTMHAPKSSSSDPAEVATLYLLRSAPSETQELISVSQSFLADHQYKHWMFPLLSDSKISLKACVPDYNLFATFYLLQGDENFDEWKNDKFLADTLITQSISTCDEEDDTLLHNYRIDSDGQFFLVFDNLFSSTLRLTLNITQELYSISPDVAVSNCSIELKSEKSCNLTVPLTSYYSKALLKSEQNSKEINWETNNVIRVQCHLRAWLIALISVLVAAGVGLLTASFVSYLVCHKLKKNRNSSTRLISTSSETGSDERITHRDEASSLPVENNGLFAHSEAAPLIKPSEDSEAPLPPYNYDYNALPPYKP